MKRKKNTDFKDRIDKGFVHLGTFLKTRLKTESERKNFAVTLLLTSWEEVVGAEIASISEPVKISFDEKLGKTMLILLASGAFIEQVRLSGPTILERVNISYGYKAIETIKVTQTWKGRRAQTQAERKEKFNQQIVEKEYISLDSLGEFHDEGLKKNLIKLGNLVYSRAKNNNRKHND